MLERPTGFEPTRNRLSTPFLPYGRQSIDEADIAAVVEVLRGDFMTTGPTVAAFEGAFARAVSAPEAVVCANGTAALQLAYLAVGLRPEDIAIVPSVTFLATANAARHVGAEVVFADADPATGLTGVAEFQAAIERAARDWPGRRIATLSPVHLNGQLADPWGIAALARECGASVVEDACHALGGLVSPPGANAATLPVGSGFWSDAAVFSFHPVKTIAMGEGGAVTVRDPERAAFMRRVRSHGMTRTADEFAIADQAFAADGGANPWYYEMVEPGFNFRVTDMQCALGLSQLAKLEGFVARRRALALSYDAALAPLADHVRPIGRALGQDPALHLYVVAVEFQEIPGGRARVMRELQALGIGTQVHYLPVHRQPYYRDRYGLAKLPGADRYYERALSLPFFPAMSDSDVQRVADALARVLLK